MIGLRSRKEAKNERINESEDVKSLKKKKKKKKMEQLCSIGRDCRRNEANISTGISRWSSIDHRKRGIRSTVVNHRCRDDASIRWHRCPVFADISAGFEGGTKEIGTVGRSSTKCILVSRLKVARSCVTKRRIVPSAKSHVLHS